MMMIILLYFLFNSNFGLIKLKIISNEIHVLNAGIVTQSRVEYRATLYIRTAVGDTNAKESYEYRGLRSTTVSSH